MLLQKAILDLLYELLGLPQPEWTDEISVALAAVDPSDFQVRRLASDDSKTLVIGQYLYSMYMTSYFSGFMATER